MSTSPLLTTVDAAPPPTLTDGFHLVVDALKLNGASTIYGVVGIPITDLARLAQALVGDEGANAQDIARNVINMRVPRHRLDERAATSPTSTPRAPSPRHASRIHSA